MDQGMNTAPTAAGMTTGMRLPVDGKRLQDFDRLLREYKAGKKKLESRVVAAENWWKLRNEAEARKNNGIGWDDSFRAKSAWLHNVLVSKHADAMENYPEPIVLPREPGDRQQATTLSAVLPVVLEQARFEGVYDANMWQKLKTGTAVYKVTWDPDMLNGLGDICIRRVDLLSIFWEPGVTDIQKSRYVFHCELQDNDLLEAAYPQLQGKLKGNKQTLTRFMYDDTVPTDDKSLVVDVYYKLRDGGRNVLHYCKYVNDEVLASTENDAVQKMQEELQRMQMQTERMEEQMQTMMQEQRRGTGENPPVPARAPGQPPLGKGAESPSPGVSTGAAPFRQGGLGAGLGPMRKPMPGPMPGPGAPAPAVKHYGLYDHGLYPFIFDVLWPVEGSPCGYGYVDISMNPQIQLDLLDTAFLKNTMNGANPRYFKRAGSGINEEQFRDVNQPFVDVTGQLDDTGIRPIDFNGISGNYLSFYQNKVNELRETSGNTESANGVTPSGVTAASAIAALQEASGKTSRDAVRSSYRAYGELIEMVIELIRQFYDLPRQFRITGENGQTDFTSLDNSGLQPQPVGVGAGAGDMGYRLPVFDVKVKVQRRNAYTRTAQNELALQLFGLGFFNPQAAAPAMSCLEMMDFEGKDELVQRLAQNGTLWDRLQEMTQIAAAMVQKYEPQNMQQFLMMAQGAQPSITGGQVQGKSLGQEESGTTSKARARAAKSTEVEG